MEQRKTYVINILGGPGIGKSTVAADVFAELKRRGYECELALEVAKEKVWEESYRTLDDQIYIFAKQYHRLWRLQGKVDFIITDSPLLLSMYYNKNETLRTFNPFINEVNSQFNNLNFVLLRTTQYRTNGRMQTEDEAKAIDGRITDILAEHAIPYRKVPVDGAGKHIVNVVCDYV